jgi:WD40 repeat protein
VRVTALDWSDDGKRLIVGTEGNELSVWSVAPPIDRNSEAVEVDATLPDNSNDNDAWADLQGMLASIDTGNISRLREHVDDPVCGMHRTLRHRTHSAVRGVCFGPGGAVHRGRRLLAIGLGANVRLYSVPTDVQAPAAATTEVVAGADTKGDDNTALFGKQQSLDAVFGTWSRNSWKPTDEEMDGPELTGESATVEIVPGTPDGSAFWF